MRHRASPRPARRCRAARRQRDDESRPCADALALDRHGAAVQVDEMADDREPQAQASLRACRGTIRLPEALEHVRQERGIDPGAGVGDDDLHRAAGLLELEADAARTAV